MAKQHFSCKVCRGAGLHHRHGGDALFGRAIVMTASQASSSSSSRAVTQRVDQRRGATTVMVIGPLINSPLSTVQYHIRS